MALLPLAFATFLFEPYIAAKQLVLVGGAAVLALVCVATLREVTVSPLWLPMGMLAALAGVSMLRVNRYDTAICCVAGLALFAVTGVEMRAGSSREKLAATITTVGTIEAIYVLWQAIAGDPLLPVQDVPGKWRMFGTFGNPNWTGEFLAVAILVTYGRQAARFTITGALSLAVMSAALCATFARGAWLSMAVGIAAIAWCRRDAFWPALRRALIASAGMVAATAGLLILRPDAWRYLTDLQSIRGRFWIWLVTARMIWDASWGVGLGSFGRKFPEVQARLLETAFGRRFLHQASFPHQAHNDYLQLVAEVGILALPVLAVLVRRIVARGPALARDPIALGFWAGLLALMVNALVASPFYLPGSLGCGAILLGATQAAGSIRTVAIPRAGRAVLYAATFAGCVVASIWCWNRGIAEYQMDRASQAMAVHDWRQAEAVLEAARRHDPFRPEIHALLGRLQLAQRQFTIAARTYSHAATLGPSEEVFAGWSTALWYQGRNGEALQVLERLTWQRPDLEWPRRRVAQLRQPEAQKEVAP
jgi:O-antigen ligase